MDMLKVFDVASPNECFQRSESIVPQQGLALANSKLSLTVARDIAAQLKQANSSPAIPSDTEFVTAAFDRVLGRQVSYAEMQESLKYLGEQTELYRNPGNLTAFKSGPTAAIKPSEDPQQRARESFIHVLLNHNDIVTVR
jgi:hypothetical protein